MAKKVKLPGRAVEVKLRRAPDSVSLVEAVAGGEWKVTRARDGQLKAMADAGDQSASPVEQRSEEAIASPEDAALIAANQERIAALRRRRYGAVNALGDIFAFGGACLDVPLSPRPGGWPGRGNVRPSRDDAGCNDSQTPAREVHLDGEG
jgi:hypothetical protein